MTHKTELMIVCDDKSMQYANYLIQLVGQKDDSDDATVGTKDGAVSAAIYTEKQYKDTLAKITSNTHILFIGKNKTTMEQAKYIPCKIDSYGLRYGWLGKRAVMYVDRKITKEEAQAFINYAHNYQLEYKELNQGFKTVSTVVDGLMSPTVINNFKKLSDWLLAPITITPAAIYDLVQRSKSLKEMEEQQYRCLTLAVYMDGLQKFLEE